MKHPVTGKLGYIVFLFHRIDCNMSSKRNLHNLHKHVPAQNSVASTTNFRTGGANWINICRWHPTPVLLPGKSHGQRSLVGCGPWGREESDMTERFPFHFSLSCIGEGNGNPLQCSCLENPRDRGAWWAVIYGVTQSRTQLKWLSSMMPDDNYFFHLHWNTFGIDNGIDFLKLKKVNE